MPSINAISLEPCKDECCRPSKRMSRPTKPMPADYWDFPATDAGDSPPLAYLPLRAGSFRRKAVAAGSVASAKWKAAFNSQDIRDLDGVDFTLAIFAVTYRMSVHAVLRIDIRKEYLPTIMARRRSIFSTPEAWQKATDFTIERTYENVGVLKVRGHD